VRAWPPSWAEPSRRLPLALAPVGLALALVSEWYGRPLLVLLDLVVGLVLVGCGLAAWSLRSQSHTGAIMAAAGAAWFVGSFGGWFVYLHRGVLAHLLLSYPSPSPSPNPSPSPTLSRYPSRSTSPTRPHGSPNAPSAASAVACWSSPPSPSPRP
jgi:hypothetical protein